MVATSRTTTLWHCPISMRCAERLSACRLFLSIPPTCMPISFIVTLRRISLHESKLYSVLVYSVCDRNLILDRAHKDAVLPLSEPIRDTNGQMIDKIAVPNNTYIVVGIRACNRSKRIWGEDALEWKPERWLAPLPQQVLDARVPGVYSHLCVIFYRCIYSVIDNL